jgi:Protein of unknown function (DUF1214)
MGRSSTAPTVTACASRPGQLRPVNAFWSLTMYELPASVLVANRLNRYRINSPMLPQLNKDADGGVTLLIRNESPGKDKEANWLPAPKGRPCTCASTGRRPRRSMGSGRRRRGTAKGRAAPAQRVGMVASASGIRRTTWTLLRDRTRSPPGSFRRSDSAPQQHAGNLGGGRSIPHWVRPRTAFRRLRTCGAFVAIESGPCTASC